METSPENFALDGVHLQPTATETLFRRLVQMAQVEFASDATALIQRAEEQE